MLAELGQYCLILAVLAAFIQMITPIWGILQHQPRLLKVADQAARLQAVLVASAMGILISLYVQSDFSVLNVVQNSHTDKPLLYKITGSWGNHEGSLLLWCMILALMGGCISWFGTSLAGRFKARALSMQGAIGFGFLGFLIFTSNPFWRIDPIPANGLSLNPLLQDPGLAFHPPLLYLGYVGFSVAFSFAIAALLEERVDPIWAKWVAPWTLISWVSLTFGIGLGSWWAYYELGWGGFWFWDPVENVSLMPWLTGTALLHSALIVEKRDALKKWTILLAILTFSLSLIGTFIVRSGVITSVHAFANDPERGLYILVLIFALISFSLTLYMLKAAKITRVSLFKPFSKEGALVLNNLFLVTACATIFIGTIYPLLGDLFELGEISVGPPFYNKTVLPLLAPLLLIMAIAPLIHWKRDSLGTLAPKLIFALSLTILATLLAVVFFIRAPWYGILALIFAFWLISGSLTACFQDIKKNFQQENSLSKFRLKRSSLIIAFAHGGLGVAIIGALGSSLWADKEILAMGPKDQAILGAYHISFDQEQIVPIDNYISQQVHFTIRKGPKLIGTVIAEKRKYHVRQDITTEAGIKTNFLGDIFISLGQKLEDGRWSVHMTRHYFIGWLWFGIFLMGFGGLCSLYDRAQKKKNSAKSVEGNSHE